jgi:hypothetical protein
VELACAEASAAEAAERHAERMEAARVERREAEAEAETRLQQAHAHALALAQEQAQEQAALQAALQAAMQAQLQRFTHTCFTFNHQDIIAISDVFGAFSLTQGLSNMSKHLLLADASLKARPIYLDSLIKLFDLFLNLF